MHASVFRLDLGDCATPRERWRAGRSLAATLAAVKGFVAFIALEAEDGAVAGMCICVDAEALEAAGRTAHAWQRERGGQIEGQSSSSRQLLIAGEVIVQRGF
ncbi:MAG TPA: hypothetical protein VKZ96_00685 [Thermomicrobiales bacterium]|nr:hypothetical protein [Thermomicrobiales bacterium]